MFTIYNAKIVTPDEIIHGTVKINNGKIVNISSGYNIDTEDQLDAKGAYLIPGLIDIHCDAIEKEIEPRPNSLFPHDLAILEYDKRIAANGITTSYHSLSFANDEIGLRSNKIVSDLIKEIDRLKKHLIVKTKIHARYEITDTEAFSHLIDLIDGDYIDLLSIMDHSPGQGQFNEVKDFKNYFKKAYKMSEAEIEEVVQKKSLFSAEAKEYYILKIVEACNKKSVPLASHDDDTKEKIDTIRELGIKISEFPINEETAAYAHNAGMHIICGSPNVVRGKSHSNNVSSRTLIENGHCNILCSDYTPMSLLHAIFTLKRENILPLEKAVKLATLNPAIACGIADEVGSIEVGKCADLLLVDSVAEIPRVKHTFVNGNMLTYAFS